MPRHFPIKKTASGRACLNLACGIYMHGDWTNVDFNPYSRMVHYPRLAAFLKGIGILSPKRYDRLQRTDRSIISWDLRRGIPFPAGVFDAVYHSHFLEHLPRERAKPFLEECRRVLKSDGILRVVVPDLGYWADRYLASNAGMRSGIRGLGDHEKAIQDLIGQMIEWEHSSTREQRPAIRYVEKLIRGGTDRTGERHLWMYDYFTLRELLSQAGFHNIRQQTAVSSTIPGWANFQLDTDEQGRPRKPESLYLEAEMHS